MKGRKKIVKVHEEEYLYVTKHAGYNESFADTLKRLLKKSGNNWIIQGLISQHYQFQHIEDGRKSPLGQKKNKLMRVNSMKILIAEDDRDIVFMYRVALRDRDHHPTLTDNGEDCLTIYRQELKNFISRMGSIDNNKQHVFDMVLLDYRMPGTNGIEVAKEIIKINPKQRIIIASSYPRETLFYSMKDLGQLVEFVQKPFNIHTLIDAIENKQFYSKLQRLNQDAATQDFNLIKHEQLGDMPEIMLSSKYRSKKIEGNEEVLL